MFRKKVIVLKEIEHSRKVSGKPLSAIARLEYENGVCDFHLTVVNPIPLSSGSCSIFIVDKNGKSLSFDIGKRPVFFHKTLEEKNELENGFAAGIVFVKDGLPETLAFARSDESDVSLSDFKKAVAEKCLLNRRQQQKECEPILASPETACDISFKAPLNAQMLEQAVKYDDEAVATENYYELDEGIEEKLGAIRGFDCERLRNENGLPTDSSKEKEKESAACNCCAQNEADEDSCEKYSDRNRFFLSVQKELCELFERFPQDERLKKYFPDSRFVKIHYSEKSYYIVGVIKEEGTEKYICYGVPSTYSPEPPKELKGYCSFIPLSIFDMTGEGFWMMFQDAVTGNCIAPKD